MFSNRLNDEVIKRGTDILTAVDVADVSSETSCSIAASAAQKPDMPNYKPDGAGAMLIFKTESGVYVLGGLRANPALKDEITTDGTSYPEQINSTIGGYLPNPELTLKDAVVNAIRNKMFLTNVKTDADCESDYQRILVKLIDVIRNNDGWAHKVCEHTDRWDNSDGTVGTMCYLTAIKSVHCSDADLRQVDEALAETMRINKEKGANPRALSSFRFVQFEPLVANSIDSFLDTELVKAKKAYEKYGNQVAVTFNDLAVATLAKSGAFQLEQSASLSLSSGHTVKFER